MTLFSNLFKIFTAETCPGCNVSIVRTGGCKYMKCVKCNYEFCWYCLDEFYSAWHYYNTTNCPFRYGFFHGIEAGCAVLLLIKMYTMSSWYTYDFSWMFTSLWSCLIFVKNCVIYVLFVIATCAIQK